MKGSAGRTAGTGPRRKRLHLAGRGYLTALGPGVLHDGVACFSLGNVQPSAGRRGGAGRRNIGDSYQTVFREQLQAGRLATAGRGNRRSQRLRVLAVWPVILAAREGDFSDLVKGGKERRKKHTAALCRQTM